LQFGFETFWQNTIGKEGEKAARKMLIKLTTGELQKQVIHGRNLSQIRNSDEKKN